ncbi:MAG: DUF1259 domain-containing protein [Armatimonadetes bacterium]|nr:DUF1259 domain-containing protein [Armatimonadota bacterium]
MTRRDLLRGAAVGMGTAALAAAAPGETATVPMSEGPPLTPAERAAIAKGIGKEGSWVADQGVYTVPLPRNDLDVRIKGEPVPTPFGFGGWAAFKKAADGQAVLMSDTVLLQEEVNPVLSAALANRFGATAIHNHFFYEEPRVFYMHLHGRGEPGDLARRYAAAIQPSRLHPARQPAPRSTPAATPANQLNPANLARIAGHEGTVNGPVYKITVGRKDLTVRAMGATLPAAMGVNSWAAFYGARNRAHIAGDIVMLEPEVQPVIAALRKSGLEVVALHNHMLNEEPRLFFLHYYGVGPAEDLARGFRAALDELGKHGRAGKRENWAD